ncbi:MAG: basic amino acid ABC transporter substrate-binding protein [Cetobacterium sp.]
MKKIILGLFIVICSFSFGKTLLVGTNAEFVPYEYIEDGKLVGFDIELMDAIGKELGYEVKWSNMNFEGLLPALQMNKIDAVIAGMSATAERKKAVGFSKPYLNFSSAHSVIINENNKAILNKEDLKGKTIGVQIGTIQEQFAKELGANVKFYNNFLGAFLDTKENKIDGVIIDQTSGKEYLKNLQGLVEIDTIIDNEPGSSIAVRKNDQKLADSFDGAIEKLKENGKYNEIKEKYFPRK